MATSCPACSNTFESEVGMKRHYGQVHEGSLAGISVECDYCGSEFRRNRSVAERVDHNFCKDKNCESKWRSENIKGESHPNYNRKTVDCYNCGETHEVTNWAYNNHKRHFCSQKCRFEYQKENPYKTGEELYNYKEKVQTECDNCGKSMEISQRRYEERSFIACSQKCVGEINSKRLKGENHPRWSGGIQKVECSRCGKEIKRDAYSRNRNTNFFCSTECERKWKQEHQCGEKHPHWKGGYINWYGTSWEKQRRKALERDNHQCQVCGKRKKEIGHEPDVHHIDPFIEYGPENHREANRLSNLITLCSKHHKIFEGNTDLDIADFKQGTKKVLNPLIA